MTSFATSSSTAADFRAVPAGVVWRVDVNRLFAVWHNLLANSFDARRADLKAADHLGLEVNFRGTFEAAEGPAGTVVVEFADNGPGWAALTRERSARGGPKRGEAPRRRLHLNSLGGLLALPDQLAAEYATDPAEDLPPECLDG